MPKKVDFKYTLEEFYQDVINDIKGELAEAEDKNKKPNVIKELLAKRGLEAKAKL